jgi:hypothetical protein
MGSIRAKFEAFGMFLTSKKNNIEAIIAGTEAKSEQEKENQFACYY